MRDRVARGRAARPARPGDRGQLGRPADAAQPGRRRPSPPALPRGRDRRRSSRRSLPCPALRTSRTSVMPCRGRLGDDEFERRRGDDRREFLGHRLGQRQEPRSPAGGGDQCLAHRSGAPSTETIRATMTRGQRDAGPADKARLRAAAARRRGGSGRRRDRPTQRARLSRARAGPVRAGALAMCRGATNRCAPNRARWSCWPGWTARRQRARAGRCWPTAIWTGRTGTRPGAAPRPMLGPASIARGGRVLVPALAVAGDGTRLGPRRRLLRPGAGAGAATCRSPRCCSTTSARPSCRDDPWDRPVSAAVTPSGWTELS